MDSFSMLPDDVLVHILSFIDTKSSVSTSILAKRWRFLWARVPNLGFVSKRYCPETRASLSSIINRVLLLHRGYNIGIFSLVVNEKDGISNSELEMFVAALIACNVREIYLSCDAKFPRCLFTCKTLVELFLTNSGDIPEATTVTVYLPALKVLFLCDVCCESNESLQHLLSGCPVLEELTIFSSSLFPYSISSPTTKMLSLVTVYGDVAADDDDEDEGMDHEYVDVDDDDGDDDDEEEEEEEEEDEGMDHQKYFSIGTLTSLAEAYISILCPGKPIRGGISYFHYVVKLVGKICEAKTLKLTLEAGLMIGVRDSAFSALTMKFHNLTKLHLVADWRFVTKFLESADNLQDLTISTGDCVCPENWVEPDEVAACLVSRVGIVIFDKFGCTKESEFKMVRYILRNAKVLKWMAIRLKCDSNDMKFEAAQKIRSFERGSEACEIFFQI